MSRKMTNKRISAKNTSSFESALKRLEEINKCLEEQDIDLANSLQLFEEGVKLTKTLQEDLSKSEQKINSIMGSSEPDEPKSLR